MPKKSVLLSFCVWTSKDVVLFVFNYNTMHIWLSFIFIPNSLSYAWVYSLKKSHTGISSHGGAVHTPTLRLVLDRGCVGSVNLQASVPNVSALAWGSGVSRDTPPDDGKIPKERGRSLLEGQGKKNVWSHFSIRNSQIWSQLSPC